MFLKLYRLYEHLLQILCVNYITHFRSTCCWCCMLHELCLSQRCLSSVDRYMDTPLCTEDYHIFDVTGSWQSMLWRSKEVIFISNFAWDFCFKIDVHSCDRILQEACSPFRTWCSDSFCNFLASNLLSEHKKRSSWQEDKHQWRKEWISF